MVDRPKSFQSNFVIQGFDAQHCNSGLWCKASGLRVQRTFVLGDKSSWEVLENLYSSPWLPLPTSIEYASSQQAPCKHYKSFGIFTSMPENPWAFCLYLLGSVGTRSSPQERSFALPSSNHIIIGDARVAIRWTVLCSYYNLTLQQPSEQQQIENWVLPITPHLSLEFHIVLTSVRAGPAK